MSDPAPPLEGFSVEPFAFEGREYPVYWGGAGPGVVVVHEIPGITPAVAAFARRVIAEGFTVAMPSLFGTPGKALSAGYAVGQMAMSCVRREFHVLAARGSSPVTHYLRALCRETHRRCGGPGVGAIGMCLTGNFALSMMVDESVMAPVLSQPSLPFGLTPAKRRGLHVSDADLAVVKRRAAAGCGVLALRFTHDKLVPAARFETLRRELGAGVETIEIDSGPGNPHGIPRVAHSVVTNDLVDEAGHPTRAALERVLALFRERLK
ncbi:MAG: dienelactone hydrolase family protein [Myxococcales bacterium]|nr:dienelactone hydrolase family protein [Myxococcales bacterium]MCB9732471.1 dienelactone hydrolase family protein [Deltaproteobacteria bacterium]